MARMEDFNLPVRLFIKAYPWKKIDPVPWTALRKPLSECRLGLVTSAGFSTADQKPFDESKGGGDTSFRIIPDETDLRTLQEHHRSSSFDHTGIQQDPNLALPINRAHELAEEKFVRCVNNRHLSFMGSIVATGRLRTQTAPEAAALFKQDGVDIALLTPV
jgi:D-proline reductase (dithiol) PrdB